MTTPIPHIQDKPYYPVVDYMWIGAIVFIIWFHCPPRFSAPVDNCLWYLGIAFFFFISGLLFTVDPTKKFWEFVCNRASRLLWPSLVCYIFFYLLWLVWGRYHAGIEDLEANWYDPIIELLQGLPTLVAAPLWFIICLFLMQVLSFVLCKIWKVTVLPLVGILLCVLALFFDWNFYTINFLCTFFLWHALGTMFRQSRYWSTYIKTGKRQKTIIDIKEGGVIIVACQNYVIGILSMTLRFAGYDLSEAPLYMKFVIAIISTVICITIALFCKRYLPFVLKRT